MTTPAFDKAAEISRNSKVKASTAELLRGYGFYKVATTGARAWHASRTHPQLAHAMS